MRLGFFFDFFNFVEQVGIDAHHLARGLYIHLPRVGERQRRGIAVEDGHAKLLLSLADGLA